MASKGELDELFELKTNFFLGNYQGAINEASALRQVSAPVLKEVYVYRSYIAMGDASMVLAEIDPQSEQTPVELQVVYALALIAANRREEGAALLLGLPQQLGGGEAPGEAASVLLALGYLSVGRFEDALRHCGQVPSLEAKALAVQILMAINRLDLAEKEWQKMKAIEEDAPLSQLAQAWLLVAGGGDKLREAQLIYQELIDSYSPTPLLLNGLAVCHIQQGKYEEAEAVLKSSLQKNSKDPETIINLLVCSGHRNRLEQSDVDKRLFRTLQASHPNHRWLQGLLNKESIFDAVASRYLPSTPAPPSSSSSN